MVTSGRLGGIRDGELWPGVCGEAGAVGFDPFGSVPVWFGKARRGPGGPCHLKIKPTFPKIIAAVRNANPPAMSLL